MTVNKNIADSLIQHQTHFVRLANSEKKQVLRIFKKYNVKILSDLRSVKSIKKKREVRNLLKEIRDINKDLFDELLDYSNQRLSAIYAEEMAFISALCQKAVDKAFPKSDFKFNIPETKEYLPDEMLIGGQTQVVGGKLVVDGSPLSNMIEALQTMSYQKIEQKLNYAFAAGEGYEYLESELGNEPDIFLERTQRQFAILFASAMYSVQDEAFNDFIQDNKEVIHHGVYVAVLDTHTTPICMSLHGKRFPIDEGPRPPQHYGCRSQFIPEIDLDKALGHLYPYNIIKEKMGKVVVYENFGEFLRKQPKSFVEDILGIKRAELFLNNKAPLKNYIDVNDNRFYTLNEMRRKNKDLFDNLKD